MRRDYILDLFFEDLDSSILEKFFFYLRVEGGVFVLCLRDVFSIKVL